MHTEEIAKNEFRICEDLENGDFVSISISPEGLILDLYERDEAGDPYTVGFTFQELAEFLKEQGVK